MTACSDPPNRPPRDVIDRLIDSIAWAKTCMLLAAATVPGSPERASYMEKLQQTVVEPRRIIDEILGRGQAVPRAVIIELRTCELSIPKLEAGAVLRRQPTEGAQ